MTDIKQTLHRVLIVDDDPAVRELLAQVLQGPRRSVEVRDNARAALEYAEHNPVDLAFIDLSLPGTSGVKLVEKLRERFPQVHIIVCAGQVADAAPGVAHPNRGRRSAKDNGSLGELLQLADSCAPE